MQSTPPTLLVLSPALHVISTFISSYFDWHSLLFSMELRYSLVSQLRSSLLPHFSPKCVLLYFCGEGHFGEKEGDIYAYAI